MDVPDLYRAIAVRLRDIPGIAAVHYPSPNTIARSPSLVVIDGSPEGDTSYEMLYDREEVTARFTVRALVVSQRDTPREQARLDPIPALVRDALNPKRYGGNVGDVLTTLPDHVDWLAIAGTVRRGHTEEYGGEFCYAADVYLSAFFSRQPQEIPLP